MIRRFFTILIALLPAACSPSFTTIDEQVGNRLLDGSRQIDAQVPPRPVDAWATVDASESEMNEKHPATWNPPIEAMTWRESNTVEAQQVLGRLTGYQEEATSGKLLTLDSALKWAFEHGREYRFAEEDYILACLTLLLEEHLWTPQFTDDVALEYLHEDSDNDFLSSATAVVNSLEASQRLPWGGELTASYVATFAREVLGAASGDSGTTTIHIGQFTVGGSIPLLRGAGMIAQEDLIQAERNLVYASRAFEDFRRDFWFRVFSGWLNLLVQRQELENALESVALLDTLAERQRALYDAGRARLYDAAEAENRALQERSRLAGLWESHRLGIDRYKLLINWPIDQPITIEQRTLSLGPPITSLDSAVEQALVQRLDLQTARDQLVDDQRGVRNALNGVLPNLDLAGNVRFGSNDTFEYATVLPSLEDLNAEASITLGLPLDREAERIAVRASQVALERARREYRRQRDSVAIDVRNAVRDIDANLFSLDIQRRNVAIARVNIESIEADQDSYTVLDQLSAIQSLQQAQNGRARAFRSMQESILGYLLETGQLRVSDQATLEPLPGMVIGSTDSLSWEPRTHADAGNMDFDKGDEPKATYTEALP